ncbi:MAG: flagellar export protein FliJ [Leptolyngbya sp. PLA1]|nr:flagellar export protein FliJ [Leptolyngbya sp. PLA1]
MAVFRFQFEAVLRHRRDEERREQMIVAELESKRHGLEATIRQHQRGIVSARGDLRDRLTPGASVDLRSVRLQASASLHLVVLAQRAVLELAGVHQRLDRARLSLLRASVRRKAVELLKERKLQEWQQDQRRREDRALDELAVMRAAAEDLT